LMGLIHLLPQRNISVIVNTADNFVWNDLYVAPDIDSVVYALSGLLDTDKMWGVKNDTFNFLAQAKLLGLENTWFNIGDRDLAMHILRTYLMRRGYTLTDVTRYVCRRLGIEAEVLPMTDAHVETHVLTELGDLHLQEFLVKHGAKLRPLALRFVGIESAEATRHVLKALQEADLILIGPSSPPVSILPILRTRPIGDVLKKLDKPKIAVSPLVGSRPLKGLTDRFLEVLGYRGDVLGVAELYAEYGITHMVLHPEDERYVQDIRKLSIDVLLEDIIIRNVEDAIRLGKRILEVVTARR